MSAENEFDIAIVGMSGRFPGAATLDRFWQNLAQGVDSITRFSDEELLSAGIPSAWVQDSRYVKAAPVLDAPGDFDAQFFGFSPSEARTMDPQHRILLELAYEALEDSGYDPDRFAGRVGVFTGAALNTYFLNRELNGRLAEDYIPTLIGADKDFLSTRIAYKLNLKGPSITIQTACSTSMVAVHLARQSLLSKETDMVLAGGISVRVPHRAGYFYDGGGVVSPDAVVRSFDAKANGTVFGSGGGILVLKRLADALADGDAIHAVIKGSAVNNDGSEKAGYTAPSVNGQADAVIEALANADVDAETISYVEAHGSGTPVGDPIEIGALTKAFRTFTERSGFCAIGSVKTNVGHLDAAAAVTAIIKTVLALKHGKIPPSLHFSEPNPQIHFAETPFYVNSELRDWNSQGPRRAGVMSTGMGGTNAYLVLEEATQPQAVSSAQTSQLLVLSAKTEAALDEATHRLHEFLTRNESVDLGDVAFTLQVGRKAFPFRRYMVCSRSEDAITSLGVSDAKQVFSSRTDDSVSRPVVLLLPGVGDHYVGMGHELYETASVFRDEVDRCAQILGSYLGLDIRKILYPSSRSWKNGSGVKGIDFKKLVARKGDQSDDPDINNLNKTIYTQPALFTIEYSLACLWRSLGVTPDAIVGHSMGEYVAACLAGVLSLEDALRLVAVRARLVDPLPKGGMLAVMLSEQELLPLLPRGLSIALINGPSLCVVAGPQAAVDEFENKLRVKEVGCRRVQNAHAFHSQMMDPVVKAFEDEVRKVQLKSPKIPYLSNVTGTWIKRNEAVSPTYWATHLNHPARFSDGLHQLWAMKDAVLLEAGPGRTLSVLAMQHPGRKTALNPLTASSLRHSYENESDLEFLWHAIGKLWLAGAPIKWENIERAGRRRISLPTYPFQRQNYWIADSSASSVRVKQSPRSSGVDDWFYAPTWERTTSLDKTVEAPGVQSAYWLIIGNGAGEGARLKAQLENQLAPAGLVHFGKRFSCKGDIFELDPEAPGDYLNLFRELQSKAPRALNIIHLGSFGRNGDAATSSSIASTQTAGFYSLMYMAQAIAELNITVPIKIGIVSSRVHQVTGEEETEPARATVLGPCGVIPKEFKNINCFNVDLSESQSGQLPVEVLNAVISEFADPSRSRLVAYRGKYRWERRYAQIEVPGTALTRQRKQSDLGSFRRGGVYLITGGTGGIGLAIAKYLAGICQPKIVLTKKNPFPEKSKWREIRGDDRAPSAVRSTIEKLLEIEEAGAEIEVVVAEASDLEQTKQALDFAIRRFGKIHGILHAAGIVRPGLIATTTKETTESVLGPKVYGTLILAELLKQKNIDLDFLVLFSTISSITMPYAHCDYGAANAFLDAFASSPSVQQRFRTLSVNWPGWSEAGMLTELRVLPGVESWKEDAIRKAISTTDGLEVFRRALDSGLPQVIVSPEDIEIELREAEEFDPEKSFAAPAAPAKTTAEPTHGDADSPKDDVERTLVQIWSDAFGLEHIGVNDNFFDIGGHSLTAARIVSKMERALGKRLSIAAIFRAPTIAKLAATLRGSPALYVLRQEEQSAKQSQITRVNRDRPLPLSFSQERLWFLGQLEPDNPFYNIPAAYRIRGALDYQILQRALNTIVNRHEVLRVNFVSADGVPAQVVRSVDELPITMIDLSDRDQHHREDVAQRIADEQTRLPFALENDLPIRVALIKLSAEEHILALTIHHIAVDFWSLAVFEQELSDIYAAFALEQKPRLPELPIQYADYAAWQRDLLQGDFLEQHLNYWKRQMAGAPELLELPTDRPRPEAQRFRGAHFDIAVPAEVIAGVRKLSHQHGVTPFMTFMATLETLLYRYTQQDDMVVGTTIANRTRSDTQQLIGLFVNWLPLRTSLAGDPTFIELLRRVRATALDAYAHQDAPFEKLVEVMRPARSLSYNPLVQVLLVYQNATPQSLHLPGLEVSPFRLGWDVSRSDLGLFLWENADEAKGHWIYNSDLFNRETIAEISEQFGALLARIIERPDGRLSSFTVVPDPEREAIHPTRKLGQQTNLRQLKAIKRKAHNV